ncbi:hypothetical protein Y032_0713g1755 [Ancylostoma ceylanicum]|uniref:Uncharacterized protein n=1 Tax=Ancylostoma ceylanicum TaxID=53326 RepID=A0A016WFZ0_9BILA|nr:hypothetical protein Y032_0713g1755 [Ancylostoma ceylanicum]
MLPVWREDSDPTRRRLPRVVLADGVLSRRLRSTRVASRIRQFVFISSAKEEGSVQHEARDRRLEVTCLLLKSTQMHIDETLRYGNVMKNHD